MYILNTTFLYILVACFIYLSPVTKASEVNAFDEFLVTEGEWSKGVKPNVVALDGNRVLFSWADSSYPYKVKGRVGTINLDNSISLGSVNNISDSYRLGGWTPAETKLLNDGRVAVIWSNTYEVYLRVLTIDPNGSWHLGPEQKIISKQSSVPQPDAAVLSDGRLVVAWTGYDEQIFGISASVGVVNANGVFVEHDNFQVNQLSQSVQNAPRVAAMANDRVVFTWITNDPSADSQGSGIAARVADFSTLGSVKFENEFTVNQEQVRAQFYPNILVLSDNRLVFSWKGYKQNGSGNNQMYASGRIGSLTNTGIINFASEFMISDHFVQGSEPVDLSVVNDNEVLFIWTQYGYPEKIGVKGKIVEFLQNDYIDESSVFPIEQTVQDNQNFHSISKVSDKLHLVVWDSKGLGVNGRLFEIISD
ncbi:hypothetical protein [Pseudoalteromonas luteoviolacea]|uniref:Uncharacterized protein n=1 Tax=Pseudoalteromonas luteoviolacea DSM 6061 TaxID=1365250 RepID=A0A166X8F0_9GAMM|nr:hypothetical protein [Pseudoalteromonas luteoviolacea]KZN39797.1 hypothetical protein N475_13640 [Pseudoalteromonas luteoviolacea DSM 6061]MBE0385734.1 hypothetical protein [Pseudoalteromonas luteoviolacea DSM 6061]